MPRAGSSHSTKQQYQQQQQQQYYDAPQQQQQQVAAADPPPNKPKSDKGKLTELHGEPPLIIQRNENGFLNRGRMLGEGGFARVYAATDSLNGICKAVKVISKEQLKSSKTKAKVSCDDNRFALHRIPHRPCPVSVSVLVPSDRGVAVWVESTSNAPTALPMEWASET